MKGLLRVPAFARLLVAYTLNEVAYTIGSLSLTILVYHHTGSALAAAGYFLSAQFVPALLAPWLVVRLDAHPAAVSLPVLYAAEAGLFVAIMVLAWSFTLAAVLALTLLDGTIAVAARSLARAASVAVLTPADRLQEGNALLNGAFTVCFMLAPALGGASVAAIGVRHTLLVAAGLFAMVAVSLVRTRGLPQAQAAGERAARRLRRAIAYVRAEPSVRTPLLLQGTALLAFTISVPVEIVFVQRSLHAGGPAYGGMLSLWGAGAVGGSLVYARWRRGQPRGLLAASAAALGAGFLIMALAPTLPVALVGAAVAGSGNGVEAVAARTLLQQRVKSDWMGLVMALNESIAQAVPGGGIVLGGAITALAGPRPALATAAVGSAAVALAAWLLLAPRVAEAPEGPATEAAESAARVS